MIQPTYISFEQAKLLKEKGFDKECKQRYFIATNIDEESFPFLQEDCALHNWNDYDDSSTVYYSAPEQYQLIEWLKVNHGIWVTVIPNITGTKWKPVLMKVGKDDLYDEFAFNSPQEAYSAAFDYILTKLI